MLNLATETIFWRYENQELADADLVTDLTRAICSESQLSYPNSKLQVVLSEIVTNAIDHGVLGLKSKIKDSPEGFALYLLERERRINELENGWISITLEKLSPGSIQIAVQDSGAGFESTDVYPLAESTADLSLYGRGLLIVSSLCASMTHVGSGNCIVIEFDAHEDDRRASMVGTSSTSAELTN